MTINYLKILFIQILLNLKKNFKFYYFIFLLFLFFISASIFGFWNLFSGYYHVLVLAFLLISIFFFLNIHIKNYKFISFKYSINWVEEKNFKNINPMIAVSDKPTKTYYNKLLWKSHIEQSKNRIKDINYFLPKIEFNSVDPLKTRLLFLLLFSISLFWGYNNKVIEKNIFKMFQVTFHEKPLNIKSFNILAWVEPPSYTGLSQMNIDIESFKDKPVVRVPFSSELLIQTAGSVDENIKVVIDDKHEYTKDGRSNNLNMRFKIKYKHNVKLVVSEQIVSSFDLDVINDEAPMVSFISKPETVNGVSIKFSSVAKDDYRVKSANVIFSKPSEYKHFLDKYLLYELKVPNRKPIGEVKSFFYENLSSHLWAGHNSKIKIIVYDDLNQEGVVETDLILPEKKFLSRSAKLIYKNRSDLAKKKISLEEAKKNIDKVITEKKELLNNNFINKRYQLVVLDFNRIKSLPLLYNNSFYKHLWDLALSIEEGATVSAKNRLEQIEQNLFDSINQRETDKISTNVEKYKESLESLLDLNNEDGENSMVNNENNKNIQNKIEKATNALEDLLRTGSKENLDQKIQELKQLSESLKNPNRLDRDELLKEQNKRDFINKLSELLNEQEMIMEESFNEAANRGKFKQSSEGSGGKTSKEKQENLRNTLGNIMRDIGESENEIPQELGRADRAMRQASRELENGRPDQASNAQGRAAEMLQRAMNKMRYNKDMAENTPSRDRNDREKSSQKDYTDPINAPEYQGTVSGGEVEIPEIIKVQEAQKIAKELYGRYNEQDRSAKDKKYIKNLLDWY